MNYNKMPASRYVKACANLPNMEIIRNDLGFVPDDDALAEALAELAPRGISAEELRAITHTYIGQKRAFKKI